MRYINVNQAERQPVDTMPQSLERGSLSRTERAYKALFFIGGSWWFAAHRHEPPWAFWQSTGYFAMNIYAFYAYLYIPKVHILLIKCSHIVNRILTFTPCNLPQGVVYYTHREHIRPHHIGGHKNGTYSSSGLVLLRRRNRTVDHGLLGPGAWS